MGTIVHYTGKDKMKETQNDNNIDNWIDILGNKIFTVEFITKDFKHRKLTGRLNVHTYSKNGKHENKVNDNMLCVFEMNEKQYRNFNIHNVLKLSCNNVTFEYNIHHINDSLGLKHQITTSQDRAIKYRQSIDI